MKNLKYHILEKAVLSIICNKCKNKDKKISKEKSIEILKILGLIENI